MFLFISEQLQLFVRYEHLFLCNQLDRNAGGYLPLLESGGDGLEGGCPPCTLMWLIVWEWSCCKREYVIANRDITFKDF